MARWFAILALVFVFSAVSPAQTPKPADDQKAKEKVEKQVTIADAVLTDVAGLGLGENRAFVYAKIGGLLWKSDRKTASSMFQRSVSELVNAQSMAESEWKNRLGPNQVEIRISQGIRPGILMSIGAFDAAFALESMFRTRTGSIQRAMAQTMDPAGKISDLYGSGAAIVRSELNLEQRLTRLAADQDPEMAIKILQESIRKGVTAETLSLLKKLFTKDPESANSLASDTLDKLRSANFSNDPADADGIALTTAILSDFIREKKPGAKELKFDETQIRALAQKLIDFMLAQDPRLGYQRFGQVIAIAEKLSPNSVKALKKLQKRGLPRAVRGMTDPSVRSLIDGKSTPEQMVAEADKMAADLRPFVYQGAANKLAQKGDLNGATELLNTGFAGPALENAINTINNFYASYLMGQGKFAEAERFIADFPDATRRQAYLNLATRAFAKDRVENRTFAIGVLRKVRTMMPDRPADNGELSQFMQLATAYAPIELDEAFNCLEPLMAQLSALADAGAAFQGFQGNPGVRSGEFVMATGGTYGFQFDPNTLKALAKADFDRALKLIDTIQRREIRISLRLQLAENGLN